MIIKKQWEARRVTANITMHRWLREGWFLFGIIPLYVRDITPRYR